MRSSRQNRWLVASVLGAVAMLLGVIWLQSRRREPLVVRPHDGKPKQRSQDQEADADYVVIGGVRRKASDFKRVERAVRTHPHHPSTGITSMVPADANEDVASLAEALREKKYPERVSPLAQPKKFNLAEFEKDPDAYLHVVEPGRVFQTAQPGPGIGVIRSAGPRIYRVLEGDSITFRVQAIPGAPVTFTSFQLGQFSNRLTSISVRADKTGLAQADFLAAPGPFADMHVLAGSPVTTGQVRFVINILSPDTKDASGSGKQK